MAAATSPSKSDHAAPARVVVGPKARGCGAARRGHRRGLRVGFPPFGGEYGTSARVARPVRPSARPTDWIQTTGAAATRGPHSVSRVCSVSTSTWRQQRSASSTWRLGRGARCLGGAGNILRRRAMAGGESEEAGRQPARMNPNVRLTLFFAALLSMASSLLTQTPLAAFILLVRHNNHLSVGVATGLQVAAGPTAPNQFLEHTAYRTRLSIRASCAPQTAHSATRRGSSRSASLSPPPPGPTG